MQTSARAGAIQTGATEKGRGGRKRIETVVETLATLRSRGESLSEVAHDARNMVTALGLYCDLLEEPGVLTAPFTHYGTELRLVASASRRLVEKLVALDANLDASQIEQPHAPYAALRGLPTWPATPGKNGSSEAKQDRPLSPDRNRRWDLVPAVPIANLAAELLANRNLLSALAGPSIALTMETDGGAQPVRLTGEDLTRILVNQVKNAAEAIAAQNLTGGGRIHIGLSERPAAGGAVACLLLTIEDNGPGIPPDALENIFASGYTTHGQRRGKGEFENNSVPFRHRGLGLAITRSVVEGAGGRIAALNRAQGGARFEIELPVRQASY